MSKQVNVRGVQHLSIDGTYLQPGGRVTFMVANDNLVYNKRWGYLISITSAFSLIVYQVAFVTTTASVKKYNHVRSFLGRPISESFQMIFAVLLLASYLDDLFFLIFSTYTFLPILTLNLIANLILPITCLGMAFYMQRSSLESITGQRIVSKSQSFFNRL
jgi:hypothetical protein